MCVAAIQAHKKHSSLSGEISTNVVELNGSGDKATDVIGIDCGILEHCLNCFYMRPLKGLGWGSGLESKGNQVVNCDS